MVRRFQRDRMAYNGKKTWHQAKVRPLTSHGYAIATVASLSDETSSSVTDRPKTAPGLRRKKMTNKKLISAEETNGKIGKRRNSSKVVFSTVAASEKDADALLSSSVPSEVLSSGSSNRTITAVKSDLHHKMRQNKPSSMKPLTKANISSHDYPVYRKVAWQSDVLNLDLGPLRVFDGSEGLCSDGSTQCYSGGGKESDDEEEQILTDSFQPPDLNAEDSGNDYETELEELSAPEKQFDSSGRRTYLRLCKKEDILPVSGLKNQFLEKEMLVRHRGLGWEGTKPLAKSLMKNIYVEKLDLSDNYIEGLGASLISNMLLDNCYISELDLSENFIGAEGGMVVAEMLTKNQVLRKVILRANRLTDRVAKRFAETLRENRTLWYLDLSHNEIGERGAVYLGAGLALNYGLKHLDLSWNCIRGKGGVAIAQALKTNDSLAALRLSWNGISLLGCVALGKFLRRNENIKELDLRNNRIGYLGAQRLSPGISRNSSLEVLKVGLNPIGDDGIEALLKAVKINKSLKLLGLEDITVSATAYQNIQLLEKNRDIKVITGGLGGFKKAKEMPQRMAVLLDFIKVNRLRLVDWFFQFDKDHSGDISNDEFKIGLKETGLKMTQKQLDSLIEYLDVDNNGKIEYSELLIGRDHTLREQRDFRMAHQKMRDLEDMRARLPTIEGFEPE